MIVTSASTTSKRRGIMADPLLIESAPQHVETPMSAEPYQHAYAQIWRELLTWPPSEIAAALVEDSERGRLLRETRPVFGRGFSPREVVALLEQDDARLDSLGS